MQLHNVDTVVIKELYKIKHPTFEKEKILQISQQLVLIKQQVEKI